MGEVIHALINACSKKKKGSYVFFVLSISLSGSFASSKTTKIEVFFFRSLILATEEIYLLKARRLMKTFSLFWATLEIKKKQTGLLTKIKRLCTNI